MTRGISFTLKAWRKFQALASGQGGKNHPQTQAPGRARANKTRIGDQRCSLPPGRRCRLFAPSPSPSQAAPSPLRPGRLPQDSSATLEARNIYLNRDFRDGDGQSRRDEWAQGFILNIESGYTEGTVGFGLDALGMLGIKLDSGRGQSGTDLLPVQDDGGTPGEYGKLGLTAKVRVSRSELRLGSHIPELPVVKASDSRILPQVFEGGLLTSKEIEGLSFTGGRLREVRTAPRPTPRTSP